MRHYRFKCPYCFEEIDHDSVHFRSAYVSEGESPLPSPSDGFYRNLEDFQRKYTVNDTKKREIVEEYRAWEFFQARDDEKYEKFWAQFGGYKTEDNLADHLLPVPAYRRRILEPRNPEHWQYLQPRKGATGKSAEDYLIQDEDGMTAQIRLKSGKECGQRVCPECHNPLPNDYGKYPVKFITVVGGTGSGKTVYLSQLLRYMGEYTAKNGLYAHVTAAGTVTFLNQYRVQLGHPLPDSTKPTHFQQPLVYEMVQSTGDDTQKPDTVVLYDVAGEVFIRQSTDSFAPFVRHAHGVIVLLEPNQFKAFSDMSDPKSERQGRNEKAVDLITPSELLDSIYRVISSADRPRPPAEEPAAETEPDGGVSGKKPGNAPEGGVQEYAGERPKCKTPVAVCLSKSDMTNVQELLDGPLYTQLQSDVTGVMGRNGFALAEFNARDYNLILDELSRFFHTRDLTLDHHLYTNYTTYAYFAVSALGCPVEKRTEIRLDENEEEKEVEVSYPIGPRILPRRIEEPLLWLFHEMGYTGVNEGIHYPGKIPCPNPGCGWYTTRHYKEKPETWYQWLLFILSTLYRFLFRVKTPRPNMICEHCGHKWYESDSERMD